MKKIIVNNRPHLCLFAVKKIEIGTELEYNYGDCEWPWRKKITHKQTPAVAAETEMSPRHGALHENSNQDDACTQVKIRQAPAVAIETETSPIHGASHEDSSQDDAHAQVTIRQAPAVAVETETSPIHGASHEDSSQDDAHAQVTIRQAPAVAVETETSPIHGASHEDSSQDDAHAQVLTLVDYPLSDETDEDCIEDPLLNLHCNEMYRISDVCEPLFSSNESTVDETDEDSMKNYSGVHSEHNIVPKLRRTKSLLMDRIPDFSDALFDSSEDSSEGPSFKSERASRRLQPRLLPWRLVHKRTWKAVCHKERI
ncbi:uncharacterized protein LOC127537708 [Acanthochromis polyacanthus]|uniref:uncharacterized protein LOC127537708 n=1 Tax=Acanthochromis polyacanthus TaxID=80966 RepID=UPI0022346EB3|nr:uncharacterized protein LOC127537708 [Acanthochromis polyacanthus]